LLGSPGAFRFNATVPPRIPPSKMLAVHANCLSDRPARVVSHVAGRSLVWAPSGTREALIGRRGAR